MSRTGFRIREYVLPARYLEGVGVSDEVNDGRLVDNIFLSFSFYVTGTAYVFKR